MDRSFAIGEATYFQTNGKIMIKTMIYVTSTLQSGQWNVLGMVEIQLLI